MLVATMSRSEKSACRRCLAVDEVLELITRALYDEGCGKGSVARLAATSQMLHAKAISVLWEELDTLSPLLRLLPGNVYREVTSAEGSTVLHLRPGSVVTSPDLGLFLHYTQCIKRLLWTQITDVTPKAVAHFLKSFPLSYCLFPQVRSFIWPMVQFSASAHLRGALFVNPFLQRLCLGVRPSDAKTLVHILDSVKARRPGLKELHLADEEGTLLHAPVCVALVDLLFTATLAEFVCTGPILDEALLALVMLRGLKRVDIKVNTDTLDAMTVQVLPEECFPAVQELNLRVDALDSSSLTLIQRISSPDLSRLGLFVSTQRVPNAVFIAHMQALSAGPFAPVLRQLDISVWRTDSGGEPQHCTITVDMLRPLFTLKALAGLIIYARCIDLDSTGLCDIAVAFPLLRRLELVQVVTPPSGGPPVESLLAFVEHCPDLETIALDVDGRTVPELPEGWRSPSKVRAYSLTLSSMSKQELVRAYVGALFPARSGNDPALNDYGPIQSNTLQKSNQQLSAQAEAVWQTCNSAYSRVESCVEILIAAQVI